MLSWRGLDLDIDAICKDCGGSGKKMYASTATWRGGIGGSALTEAVCDKCWGSGNVHRPWLSHREAEAALAQAQQERDALTMNLASLVVEWQVEEADNRVEGTDFALERASKLEDCIAGLQAAISRARLKGDPIP